MLSGEMTAILIKHEHNAIQLINDMKQAGS